jgi:hypothetical protein
MSLGQKQHPGDADPRPLPGDGPNATLCSASAQRE